ncbi:MAG: hypothetical protein LUD29_04030 [Clostridia bacterium]|nr:hypothetical protein [Clostridia bacterium]
MTNKKFKAKCTLEGKTFRDVAKTLGLSKSELHRKLSEKDFSIREIDVIAKSLKIDEREFDNIFFAG